MITEGFLVFLPSILTGIVVVSLISPAPVNTNLLLKITSGLGIGLGISSALYFFWCLEFNPSQPGFSVIEISLLIILTGVLIRRELQYAKKRISPVITFKNIAITSLKNWPVLLLGLVFLGLCMVSILSYKNFSFMFPHGTFDAYAIWNLRARFIFRDSQSWTNAFSPFLNWKLHADYPLLVTLNVARGWFALGYENTRIPIVQTGLFALGLTGLLLAGLTLLRDYSQGLCAAILLLALPMLPFYATTQSAEVPLAYFYLSGVIFLNQYIQRGDIVPLVLTGLCAGFAGWTKNEGLMFLISVTVIVGLYLIVNGKGENRCIKLLKPFNKPPATLVGAWEGKPRVSIIKAAYGAFISGLAIPLAAILIFKIGYAPPSDLFLGQNISIISQKLLSPERYWIILKAFSDLFFNLGEWKIPVVLALIVYLILFWGKAQKRVAIYPLGVVGLTFMGYFLIYLITPHSLEWHLKYSADRLFFHLFPAFLYIIFSITVTPNELFSKSNQEFL